MKKTKLTLLVVIMCLISGCSRAEAPVSRVVTKIDVVCTQSNTQVIRTYKHPKKMEALLYYLRTLRYCGKADTDPEQIRGDAYHIVLTYSDGTSRVYRQRANRYLSRDARPWEQIDPRQGRSLPLLLKLMPED